MRWLLLPFMCLYGLVTGLRNFFFTKGWLRSFEFDFPVILVGNLSAGGTGKTPHIEYLIRLLKSSYKVATLSRGYKRTYTGFGIATELSRVEDIGDEPKQYKQKFPDIEVAVSIDRVGGIYQVLHDEPQTQVILLDDGFQHRRLRAGLNIVLTTFQKPFYDDYLLPVGRLRETRAGKNRAQVIIVTKCPFDITVEQQQEIMKKIGPQNDRQVFFTTLKYEALYPLFADQDISLEITKPVMVTGIAGNKDMFAHVSTMYTDITKMSFADHHYYSVSDIKRIKERGDTIITTEKDAMRLMEQKEAILANGLKVFVLPVEVVFINKADVFEKLVLDFIVQSTPSPTEPTVSNE